MGNYYIIKNEGFFKKYFAGNDVFVSSVRSAITYLSSEEAFQTINTLKLEQCFVIDQNGQIQK